MPGLEQHASAAATPSALAAIQVQGPFPGARSPVAPPGACTLTRRCGCCPSPSLCGSLQLAFISRDVCLDHLSLGLQVSDFQCGQPLCSRAGLPERTFPPAPQGVGLPRSRWD